MVFKIKTKLKTCQTLNIAKLNAITSDSGKNMKHYYLDVGVLLYLISEFFFIFSSTVVFSLNFRKMLNCKTIPFPFDPPHPSSLPWATCLFNFFRKFLGVNLLFHSRFTVTLPIKFIDRRLSVSLGSDPRTIKCYGQGPTSGGNNDEMGR